MTDDVAVLKATIARQTRELHSLRTELMRRYEDAVGPCPMCKVRRQRINDANQKSREKHRAALVSLQRSA
jgi:hypothetical protein